MQSRRDFVKQLSALTLGGLSLIPLSNGCSVSGLTIYHQRAENGTISLPLSQYPELQVVGGAIQLSVDDFPHSIIVVKIEENIFAAISPVCTHLGCAVRKDGAAFRCPCHGSTYSLNGDVVRGPAEEALQKYDARVSDGMLLITLG